MVIDACPSTEARAAKEATAAKTAAVLMFGNVGLGLGLELGCYEASVKGGEIAIVKKGGTHAVELQEGLFSRERDPSI